MFHVELNHRTDGGEWVSLQGIDALTPTKGLIMPMAGLCGSIFEFFGHHFRGLGAEHIAAQLAAAIGVCFASRPFWPSLGRKRARAPLPRDPFNGKLLCAAQA